MLRDALILDLSVTRRAGIMISFFLILLVRTDYFHARSLGLATLGDHPVGATIMPRLGAQSRKTPGRLGMIALHTALTASMRMVNGIHRDGARTRTPSEPA